MNKVIDKRVLSGQRLKEFLANKGVSQSDLAKTLGLDSPQNVNNWTRRGVPPEMQIKMNELYGVNLKWIGGEETIGDRIKQRREELGISQKELGEYLGISHSAISQLERGESKGLKQENLLSAANRLQKSVHWLVHGKDADNVISEEFSCMEPEVAYSLDEIELLDLYRSLPTIEQDKVRSELKERNKYFDQILDDLEKRSFIKRSFLFKAR